MRHKYFLVFLLTLLGIFFVYHTALAQVDARCLTEAECTRARQGNLDGFVRSTETQNACGGLTTSKNNKDEPVGFCLAAGQTVTTIAFGGRRDFANMGDFIQYMYKFAIALGGILAVIVIIKSGFQWSMSGGSQDMIKKAQEGIKKSLVGLLLLVFSFTILHNINPYLTELRLPQTWILSEQSLTPAYCDEQAPEATLAKAPLLAERKTMSQSALNASYQDAKKNSTVAVTDAECGTEYFTADGSNTCQGTKCAKNNVCSQSLTNGGYSCQPGDIQIKVYDSNPTADNRLFNTVLKSDWGWPWVPSRWFTDFVKFYAVCIDGNLQKLNTNANEIDPRDETKKIQLLSIKFNFASSFSDETARLCNGVNNVKGYVYLVSLDESNYTPYSREEHYVGPGNYDFGKGSDAEKRIKDAPANMLFDIKDADKTRNRFMTLDAGAITNL